MKKSIAILIGCLTLTTASAAFAQEFDPFSAYEGGALPQTVDAPETAPVAAEAPQETPLEAAAAEQAEANKKEVITNPLASKKETAIVLEEVVPFDTLLEPFRFTVGGGVAFSYDRSYGKLPGGADRSTFAYYANVHLQVGMNVWDRVTLELLASTVWRGASYLTSGSSSEHDWVFKVRAWYTYPLWARLGVLGGIGAGGYIGSGTQETATATTKLKELTSTAGFAGDVYGGATYIFSDAWQLRMLANVGMLIGPETYRSSGKSEISSTTHVGLGLEVAYTF